MNLLERLRQLAIREQYHRLLALRRAMQAALEELQAVCKHPQLEDKGDELIGVYNHCVDCGKYIPRS